MNVGIIRVRTVSTIATVVGTALLLAWTALTLSATNPSCVDYLCSDDKQCKSRDCDVCHTDKRCGLIIPD